MESFEEKLIAAVKSYEVLYDKRKAGYKNTKVKAEIWNNIATALDSTDEICIKRWRSLRDRFLKETKKLSAPSDSAYNDHVVWDLYESLTFLRDHLMPRKTQGTHRPLEEDTESTCLEFKDADSIIFSPVSTSSQSNTFSASKPKKKDTGESTDNLTAVFQSAVEAFKNACAPEDESTMKIFMRSIACKLESLPVHIQNNAILNISEYVIKLENYHLGLTNEMPDLH